jgi:hypothetical protein
MGWGDGTVTPTLGGRWQTRILLLATLGLIVTALFAAIYRSDLFFLVLGYVALFGLAWDVLYVALQRFRWDRDWPAAFQVLNGIVEGALVYLLIATVGLPGIATGSIPLWLFVLQYGLVWLVTFLWAQGPMRAIFPFWRFHGGRVVPAVSSAERRP